MGLKILLLIGIALVHVLGSRFRFLHVIPRSTWLSVAGGASVAYIFLHLIPELLEASESFHLFKHDLSVFIIALAGLCFVYGLEKLALDKKKEGKDRVFWVHIVSYFIYNAVIGYLLISEMQNSVVEPILFSVAMALHFIVNDYSLLQHHKHHYLHVGRWMVAGAVLIGGLLAIITEVSEQVIYSCIAFISGGIIMNVMKEELPEDRKSRYWAFLLGAALYSVLLFYLNEAE